MRILVVDDDPMFLEVIVDFLRENGHDVVSAEDGKQAREILETECVDLIVSDVVMQGLDGKKFHSYVREFLGATDTPFIFYSGYSLQDSRHMIKDSSVDFFLSKSDPLEDMVNLISTIQASREGSGTNHDAALKQH